MRWGTRSRSLAWAAAAVGLWLAGDMASLTTTVVAHSDGRSLTVTSGGARLTSDTPMPRLSGVEVRAVESVDPPRGGQLVIAGADGAVVELALPAHPGYRPRWPPPVGDWHVDRDAATARLAAQPVELAAPFTVTLSVRGRALEAVTLHLAGPRPVEIRLRRGLINDDLALARPGVEVPDTAVSLPPRVGQRLAAALAVILRGGAAACALLGFAVLAAAAGRRRPLHPPLDAPHGRTWWMAVVTLAALAIGRSAWIAGQVLERVPHTPDAVAYLLQARWLLAGWLVAPAPALPSHFAVPFTFVRDGGWYSQYPPGWPVLLAVGDAAGAAWLVAPLLGGVFVLLVALLGREAGGSRLGLLAALLALLSPLVSVLFASHLSHAAAAPLVAAFLWLVVAADHRQRPALAAPAGLALGLAAGIRPLTAVAVAVPVGLLLVAGLTRRDRRRPAAEQSAWLVAGGTLGLAPTLLANAVVTGSPLRFAYSLLAGGPIYGPDHVALGVRNLDATTASLAPQLLGLGWGLLPATLGAALAVGLVLVPLLRRHPPASLRLLALIWPAVAIAYVGTSWQGLHGYGPRYHFEAVAALLVLAAAGMLRLASIEAGPPDAAGRRRRPLLTWCVLGVMLLAGAFVLPPRMALYRHYNLVDGSLVAAVRALPREPTLVVFTSSRWYDWGRAAPLLPPEPTGDLVFAAEAGDLFEMVDAYPGYRVYLWQGQRLVPVAEP